MKKRILDTKKRVSNEGFRYRGLETTRLENLSDEIGAEIHIVEHPEATVEELIDMVAKGEIDFTISDEFLRKRSGFHQA